VPPAEQVAEPTVRDATVRDPTVRELLAQRDWAALRRHPLIRYVIVGGCTFAFELAVILVARHEGVGAVWAVALSFWLGLLVSFVLQKLITFGDKRVHHKVVLPQFGAFAALVSFNFGFTVLMTYLFQHVMPVLVVRTLALLITTIWNFYLYKTKIFRVPIVD
jgi:putative flippase GtrA